MPPSTEETVMSKAKTALIYFSIAVAVLLLLHTVKNSSTIILWIAATIMIAVLIFHNRHNPDRGAPHAPLFSFPSFSPQPRYEPFVENNFDLPEPAVSPPAGVTQHLEPDMLYDNISTDVVASERGEPSERTSTVFQEQEISCLADDQANDDQGSDDTLDQTWNSIIARGNAKPFVRSSSSVAYFERSNQREDNPKPEMRRSATEKRREKKKAAEGLSYDPLEKKAQGWRKREALGISSEELSHLSEMFINKQRNDHRIERQESDQRRVAERLRFNNYRNAVTAN
ncbi:hypothetical protein LUZ62_058617 [Rhynchospora pubera]|uniref:Uncharacterized protein n=1 Tax=Rhynchospora pubera TaxID=906938 RepID=A0AAV8E4V1_9POAL|nr:hypothetical protein LUZ62_058617 [Rhynchospora pubera]